MLAINGRWAGSTFEFQENTISLWKEVLTRKGAQAVSGQSPGGRGS